MDTENLQFTYAVHPSTGEVFCDCIPEEVKSILNDFKNLAERVIFNHAFHMCITKSTPGPIEDVQEHFERARRSYEEELDRLTRGLNVDNSVTIHQFLYLLV